MRVHDTGTKGTESNNTFGGVYLPNCIIYHVAIIYHIIY